MTTIEAPAGRPALLTHAAATTAVCAGLMVLAYGGRVPLAVGVGVLQVLLLLGFLALVDAPAALGLFTIGTAAAVAGDVVVQVDDGRVGGLGGVVALAFVAGLLHQLARGHRSRVTESLADTLVVVVLVTCAACLPAALQHMDGEAVVRAGLLAGGAALAAGRVVDRLLPRLALATGASRGWPGLVVALLAGTGAAVPEAGAALTTREAVLTGLACAVTAISTDLFADLAATEVLPHQDDRRRMSLRPVTLLLPYAVLGPVTLVVVRLLERT